MVEARNGTHQSVNGGASASGNAYVIDSNSFSKRLKMFYSHWEKNGSDLWGSCKVLTVSTPPPSDDLRYLKSSALNIWLLGYEFPETIMAFMKKEVHILCSQKKASVLESVKKPAMESVGAEVTIHAKAKSDGGGDAMDAMLRAIRAQSFDDDDVSSSESPIAVGHIARESPEGVLLENWTEKLKSLPGIALADVSNGLSDLFGVKDGAELMNVKMAAFLTASVMKNHVVPKLENVIDEEKKVTHASLMDDAEKAILEPSKAILEPLKVKVKLKAENVDICYPPIFQSGGKFDLRPGASSNDDVLCYDSASVIICAVGSRYSSYCANLARTIFINATESQARAYDVLLKSHEAAIGALRPGRPVSAVYQAAAAAVRKSAPELAPYLTRSAGTGIGLEFRESGLNLNAKNDRTVRSGMVFNVSLGFHNLPGGEEGTGSKGFSLLLADTVIVGEKTEVATSLSSKATKDVMYSFNDDEDDDEATAAAAASAKSSEAAATTATKMTKTALRSDNHEVSKEDLRRQHQAELARQKNEETARRLAGVASGGLDGRSSVRSIADLMAYKTVADVPSPRDLVIQLDQKSEAVLLPIYGVMVPFHVAMIRTVSSQQDTNRNCYIRVMFNVPGMPFSNPDPSGLSSAGSSLSKHPHHQGSVFLKEVSFRSKDPRHVSELVQQIKTLRRNVVARESERAERATLVTQERLQPSGAKFKPVRLTELWIRPVFAGRGRKLPGTLEAHLNGFRYSTTRQEERVDVMYANVKHAFVQPAEREMITLLHFHLHNHIMVGNKKTKDVQFYVEVMDVVQTLGGGKRSAYDPDEIEEEQRERERKNRINADFAAFVGLVHDLWGQPPASGLDLEFDQPLRELGFHGVPHKTTAFVVPTSGCLVELIEMPFVVVTLTEIEIVNLERVGLGQKNFDMSVVFKDFKRDVFRIDSIPSTSLDGIKEWLDTTDIKYYESRLNLNWKQILKTITDDPQSFIDEGGWEFLNMDATDSESGAGEGSENSDDRYEPDDVSDDDDDDSEDSDSESLVESEDDDDDSGDSDADSEEKGKTWEELEREASNADREKGDESDSEEERKRHKKAFVQKRPPPPAPPGNLKRPKFR